MITSATLNGGQLTITYNVPSDPMNSTYPLRVEFFRADADGQEGQTFLGFDTFTITDFTAGSKAFTFAAAVGVGNKIVATATDSKPTSRANFVGPLGVVTGNQPNNTSEFSAAATVTTPAGTRPDLQATKTNSVSGVTTLGSNWTWTVHVSSSAVPARKRS